MLVAGRARGVSPSPGRAFVTLLIIVFGAFALAACGADRNPASTSGSASGNGSSEADPFPVEVDHKYGTTEIEAPPERIVTVGLTDHDAFLAFGVVPVGVTDWYGDRPHATWPWARDELGDAEPAIVGNAQELNFERIAGLEPDVIVGLYSALTEKDYETLSQIAPTVAQPGEYPDWSIPWQELTLSAARIAGRVEQGEALVAEIEDRFAEIRADHPEFEEASAAIATPYEGIYIYSDDVANGRLLSSLGFEWPADLAELIGGADGANLSSERVDLLDTDVLLWLDAAAGEGPLSNPLYRKLDVHSQGRELFLSSASELGGAMSFSSVLSLPFLLDELVPMLEVAIDGDPATEPPTTSS